MRRYIDRDLSWLDFNSIVIDQYSENIEYDIPKSLKFLAIAQSNIKEFLSVRIPHKIANHHDAELLNEIVSAVKSQLYTIDQHFNHFLETSSSICRILTYNDINTVPCADDWFMRYYKLLKPQIINENDLMTPSFRMSLDSMATYMFARLSNGLVGVVKVPKWTFMSMNFIVTGEYTLGSRAKEIFNSELIDDPLFVTPIRNANMSFDEDTLSLLDNVRDCMKTRESCDDFSAVVIGKMTKPRQNTIKMIEAIFKPTLIFTTTTPMDLTQFRLFRNNFNENGSIVDFPMDKDFTKLLSFPRDSFYSIVRLLQKTLKYHIHGMCEIKHVYQTIYRTDEDSSLLFTLKEMALNGIPVTVLMEVKARQDEANNIDWIKALESVGCKIIYGLVGLKTHAKLTLIQTDDRDYSLVSTGNYKESTSKLYTDLCMVTTDSIISKDIEKLFNVIEGKDGNTEQCMWGNFIVSPINMVDEFKKLIETETRFGENGYIGLKMNALTDVELIESLYNAADAGVTIDLVIRGACSICEYKGIKIRTIVGDYLEHSRIYKFKNSGTFIGSADWMPRNLYRRIEVVSRVPEAISEEVDNILESALSDTVGAYTRNSEEYRGYAKICSLDQYSSQKALLIKK